MQWKNTGALYQVMGLDLVLLPYELETNDLTSLSLYEMGLMINTKDVAQSLTPQ